MQTIVFVHGAWMTPTCWSQWTERFRAAGYECVAPAWPYMDSGVQALRDSPPDELATVGLPEIVDHYAAVADALDEPVFVGHSFGGLVVQLLLDRGLGAAGVALHPGPPRGVLPSVDAVRASLPVATTWNHQNKVVRMSFEDFCWGWAADLPPDEQRRAYDDLVVPTPGRVFFQAATGPFTRITKVDFERERAPLFIVAGGKDRTVSASMNEKNFKLAQKSPSRTDFKLYPERTHFTLGAPGWEAVADDVQAWIADAT